jgi:hypothetical protein
MLLGLTSRCTTPCAQAAGDRAAGDVLADQVREPLVLADVVHRHGVRVVAEPRHRPHLAPDALALRLLRRDAGEEAQRDLPVELEVARQLHSLAGPLAEMALDPVAPAGDRHRRTRRARQRDVLGWNLYRPVSHAHARRDGRKRYSQPRTVTNGSDGASMRCGITPE